MIKRSFLLRIVCEALGLVLSGFAAFAMALLIERLFAGDVPVGSFAVCGLVLLLSYLAGRFMSGRNGPLFRLLRVLCVLAAATLAAAVAYSRVSCGVVPLAALVVLSVIMCYAGSHAVPVYPQVVSASSVLIYLVVIVLMNFTVGGSSVVSACAAADFVLFMLSANLKGVFEASVGGSSRVPPGIMGKNAVFLAIFAVLAFALAATGIIQWLIANSAKTAWRGATALWGFIKGLFPERELIMDLPTGDGPTQETISSGGTGPWIYLVYFVLIVIAGTCLFFAIRRLIRFLASYERRPRRQRRRRRRLFADNEEEDIIESTLDLGEWFARGRQSLLDRLSRLRRRPGFNDMPTDAERVRFAFRELKRACATETKTPLELGRDRGTVLQTLVWDYSAMRYGDIQPTQDSAKNARHSLSEIKKIRKSEK